MPTATDTAIEVKCYVFPDNTRQRYTYDISSRLSSITDALGQTRRLGYHLDNREATESFTNPINPTPAVQWTYDPHFPRMTSVTDTFGNTTVSAFSYVHDAAGMITHWTQNQPADTVRTAEGVSPEWR